MSNKTNAQLLSEMSIKREFDRQGIILPNFYWNLPQYKKIYKERIFAANSLLKLYSMEAIVKSFEELKWCYSLRTPKLKELCRKYEDQINKQKERAVETPTVEVTANTTSFRKNSGQSKLSKLD